MPPLPFIPGQIYQRAAIHDQYGGSRQSGICPSAKLPYIFIFSGSQGLQHGYKDQWDNKYIFSYTGEGQLGDMAFTRGNLALRDHLRDGKRVFLFEYVQRGYVRFISEMEFFDFGFFETHDRDGVLRIGIKFFFKRAGVELPISREMMDLALVSDSIPLIEALQPNETERSGLVTTRVGQGAYRKSLLHRWEYQCAVTQFNDPRILIASHIVPWKDASDAQRLDVDNGIILSPTYDALFDRHLISFENSGRIVLSDNIEYEAFKKIGVTGKEKIQKDLTRGNLSYLGMHQQDFQQKSIQL